MKQTQTRQAYETLIRATHNKAKKLLKQGLYENSQQESHYIRSLQDLGVWLDIVK